MKNQFAKAALAVLAVALAAACAERETVAPVVDGVDAGEWVTWGGDPGNRRYSPLDQIDSANVSTLEVAWRWKAPPWETRPDSNMKATPLYVDGALYAPVGVNQAVAINPTTGQTIWTFNPEPAVIPGGRAESVTSRALAWWSDGTTKRLFHNTRDGRLISIDAATGKTDPAFGENGYIQLGGDLLGDGQYPNVIGSSSPPTVVGDVVVAQTVPETTSPNKEGTPGFVRGYDVRTGKLLWTFHTIPREGEFGVETWEEGSWAYTGNAGVWTMMSADPELGYVYLPVETAAHDFYGGHRKGDNLFAESLVCLDAKTGKRVWHFQIVHHGVWDYDPPAAPILHDIVKDGRTIKAVTQLTKQGLSFVFDRATGEPVWPIEERPVPQDHAVYGERLSPTQPFPTKPAPYVPMGYSEDDLIDFTPALRAEALKIVSKYVLGPIYTPPTLVEEGGTQGTYVQPGYGGGSNWNGGAYDPETRLMFVPVRNKPMVAGLGKADPAITNWDYIRLPTGSVEGPQGLPITKPPYSWVTATNMDSADHTWMRAIGEAPVWIRNHPALQGLEINFTDMGEPNIRPSPLVTKTLLFLAEAGNLSGDPGGPMFRAYDKTSGDIVSEFELPGLASAAPMTFLHEGRQYIVIAVSSADHPAELVALALPGARALAPQDAGTADSPAPGTSAATAPAVTLTAAELAGGKAVYARACAACHGDAGQGVPGGPPKVTGLTDLAAVTNRIANGGVEMPAMSAMLTAEEIAQVSKYVAAGLPQ